MFDNKFLKHPGIGFKLLLPAEVANFLKREEKEFYERSRLDKQNLVLSLEWTGESLYDVANDRIKGCVNPGQQSASIRDLFDPAIEERELIATFARLACRGTCSSSSTGCSSNTPIAIPIKIPAGKSGTRRSNRPWPSTSATLKRSTEAWAPADADPRP